MIRDHLFSRRAASYGQLPACANQTTDDCDMW